ASLYGPEVNTHLPPGIAVKYQVQLGTAIKDAIVEKTKAKDIKIALTKAKWTFAGDITDAMDKDTPPKGLVGNNTLKFKIGNENLPKKVRCNIAGPAAKSGGDEGGGSSAPAVK